MDRTNHLPTVRTGQAQFPLSKTEFQDRFRARFADPQFRAHDSAIEELCEVAWDGYQQARKSPSTRKAGSEFADPEYELSVDWLAARVAIQTAQQRHEDTHATARVLLICGADRNDKTCPGEMSKTFRLAQIARETLREFEVDLLDLSHMTS